MYTGVSSISSGGDGSTPVIRWVGMEIHGLSNYIWNVGVILYCGGHSSLYNTEFNYFITLKGLLKGFSQSSQVNRQTLWQGCRG